MEDRVTLYIATHNITGKKYFGKTVKWFTNEDLQKNYNGSGEYWKLHKKKHGDKDVTMEIYQICSLNEADADYVVPIALKFSEENNIAESEEWANFIPENGLNGRTKGDKNSEETKAKISESSKGKKHTKESKDKMSRDRMGHTTSDETKAKISESAKNRKRKPHSEETKAKMRKPKAKKQII